MRLPRVTVRRLMVAEAIVVLLMWVAILAGRSLEYRRLAVHHGEVCRVLSGEIASLTEQAEEARSGGLPTSTLILEIGERRKALVEEERAASMYRARAWRPWQVVRYR